MKIRVLEFGALRGYSILKDRLTAVSVGTSRFVLVDVSKSSLLLDKVSNIYAAVASLKQRGKVEGGKKDYIEDTFVVGGKFLLIYI